jgi:putative cell wall-binding protein
MVVLLATPSAAYGFTPRTTAPSTSDYHYYSTQNPFYASGYGMPNCTCYAWGRAWEIRGSKLPVGYTGNANTWWNPTALPKGSVPRLGAIAVWGGAAGYPNYGAGHVAVVEAISGSTITVSQSSWGGAVFTMDTVAHINTYGGCGPLLGYIYTIDATPRYNPIAPGDSGFAKHGTASGWSSIGGGYYGTGIYTWSGSGTRDNYARWTFDLSKLQGTRTYKVEAYITSTHAGTTKADYHINTSAGLQHATVNQADLSNVWASLGARSLVTGSAWIELDDVTGDSPAKEIAFDAIKLTPYYAVKYTVGPGGTLSGTSTQSILSGGSATKVTAVPSAGYHFVKWSDGVTTAARTDANIKADKSVSASFASNYTRFSGTDRFATAIKASQAAFSTGGCSAVVIATGLNYPDALSAAGLAGTANAPILLVSGDALRADVKAEIQRVTQGKASFKVYIMGSTAAVSAKMEASISSALTGESIERLAGANRYATSQLVAAKIKALRGTSFGTKAILVSGQDYVDGLIVGPAAFATKTPILLVSATADPALKSALSSLGIKDLVVLGTTARVPTAVETSLKSSVTGLATRRVSSATDTYERSAAAAEYFATAANGFGLKWSGIGIVTAEAFPDGLGASCVEGKLATSLLLTKTAAIPSAISSKITAHKASIGGVRFYGSTAAVSAAVETSVKNLLK